jgi:hypothetical protein
MKGGCIKDVDLGSGAACVWTSWGSLTEGALLSDTKPAQPQSYIGRSDVEALRPGPLIRSARPITPDMLQVNRRQLVLRDFEARRVVPDASAFACTNTLTRPPTGGPRRAVGHAPRWRIHCNA